MWQSLIVNINIRAIFPDILKDIDVFSSVQSLRHVWLLATPWTEAHQASLSITNYQSLLKLMSIELMMPSKHLNLCHPLLLPPSVFPSIRVFSNESVFRIRWQKYWNLASASVLPMNIQGWFPLGWTGWISLKSKGLPRVFSTTIVQKEMIQQMLAIWSLFPLPFLKPIWNLEVHCSCIAEAWLGEVWALLC